MADESRLAREIAEDQFWRLLNFDVIVYPILALLLLGLAGIWDEPAPRRPDNGYICSGEREVDHDR